MIADLHLHTARPSDRIHLLRLPHWDTATATTLTAIAQHYRAPQLNYQQHLRDRLSPSDQYLSLHYHLDRELTAICDWCSQAPPSPILLLHHLDLLITYYRSHPHARQHDALGQLWHHLEHIRHLPAPLWVILPSRLCPDHWPRDRQHTLTVP